MRIAVIGGGITGLTAAYALRDHEVILLERDRRLGGKILTERVDGFLLEAGPDSFLTTKPQAVELSRTVGLGEQLIGTTPQRTVYVLSRGRLHPLPEGLMLIAPTRVLPLARSSLFTLREKLRIAADLVLPPAAPDGDEPLGAFVRRRMGQAALDRLAAPLLAGIYAGDADRLSLRATFPQLVEMERHHGSLIAGMLAQRRARSGPATPSADGRLPLFMTIRDGLDLLVDRLREAAGGVEVRIGSAVTDLTRDGSGYRLHLDNGDTLRADAVVCATPAYVAAQLLSRLVPDAAALLRQIPYASTATISLGYRRADMPPLAGHGFVVARGEGYRLTACTWTSAKWPARAPDGFGLLRAYVGSAADPEALERSDEEIVALVQQELARAMGLAGSPVLARVARWSRSMPQYLPGHLDRLREIDRVLSGHRRLVLAGAGYGGIGLPDCIRQGAVAAARITTAE